MCAQPSYRASSAAGFELVLRRGMRRSERTGTSTSPWIKRWLLPSDHLPRLAVSAFMEFIRLKVAKPGLIRLHMHNLFFPFPLMTKGISANLMQAGSKRRRTKKQIEEDKEEERLKIQRAVAN